MDIKEIFKFGDTDEHPPILMGEGCFKQYWNNFNEEQKAQLKEFWFAEINPETGELYQALKHIIGLIPKMEEHGY